MYQIVKAEKLADKIFLMEIEAPVSYTHLPQDKISHSKEVRPLEDD